MTYRIERIDLLARETPPTRVVLALGKAAFSGKPLERGRNSLGYVRLTLGDERGRSAWGTSADQLAVRWLDKRPGRSEEVKHRELVTLLEQAREIYLKEPAFDSPFQKWHACCQEILKKGRAAGQEDLTAQFSSALIERALLDAVCRLEQQPIFRMVRDDRLGFRPGEIHAELKELKITDLVPERPVTRFHIRHTIGQLDALRPADLQAKERLDDGLPETLEDYIQKLGLRCFKVLLSGDPDRDFRRLAQVWAVLPQEAGTIVSCDANEAYDSLESFAGLIAKLERDQPGLFQHLSHIEQPVPRALAMAADAERWVRKINLPLVIDEADDRLDAFKKAVALGYRGTANKACKGFFKSLLNRGLVVRFRKEGHNVFQTGEDLQNLPPVALHQDFVTLSILGIDQCQRNGYHYNHGLGMVTAKEKPAVLQAHPDMYVQRGQEAFWNIQDGRLECGSLQCPGFGVKVEPDWGSMTELRGWLKGKYGS